MRSVIPRYVAAAFLAFLFVQAAPEVRAQSVASGFNLYATTYTCKGCHITNATNPPPAVPVIINNSPPPPGGKHLAASNNPGQIATGFATGAMSGGGFGAVPTANEQFALALYIGQYKAPLPINSTLTTTVNTPGTKDVYALLPQDGTSGVAQDVGGVTATNGANGTTSVTIVPGGGGAATFKYNITYTPNPGFVGADTFNYTITNATGNATRSIAVTVNPAGAPTVTSPTAAAGTFGVAFAGQIVASNPPITAYSATGLPPGLTVNTVTGAITGTPTTTGTFNVTLTATNAVGTSPGLVVPFTIGATAPVGSGLTMTVPLNTPTTVDLASSITGFAVTGISIVTAPRFGTATVNGTQVTYTPRNNYFGPDSFTYVGFGAGGTSAPAVVTVNVVGRPDPTADATVIGTISNQVQTARRFSQSQLSNYQQRMESLHRGGNPPAGGENARLRDRNAVAANNQGAGAKLFPDPAAPAYAGNGADMPSNVPLRGGSLNSTPVSTDPAVGAAGSLPPNLVSTLLSAATSRSINLGAAAGAGGTPESTSFWLGGDARFGTRDNAGGGSTNFKTNGVSAGVDRRFNDKLVLGVGLGFARDRADIGTDGSQSRATGTSAAFYGSYQPTSNTFVDGLLGYGSLSFDSDRFVAPIATLAHSHRSGDQIFGSVAAGYEHRSDGVLLSPYGRLDFSVDRLKQASESGVGNFALTYFDQTSRTLRSALGLRAESSHETELGLATPRIRLEYQHGFEGGQTSQIAYSDLINTRYGVTSDATSRNSIVFGLGSDFVMRNGVTLGIDYQVARSFSQETSQAIRFRLSKELDGKSSSASLLPNFDSTKPLFGIRVDAGYTYDRNVTRGRDSNEKLSDQSYSLDLSKGWIFPLTEHTRAVVALSGGAEKFHSYDGLSQLHGGVLGELQYRTSGSFGAPTFALFTRVTGEQFESYLRDGYRTSMGLSVRKPLTDRISLFSAVAHNERNATSSVFTGRDNSFRLNVDYAATAMSTFYVTGEYRRGDAVSSGRPSLASLDIAKVIVADDAFADAQLTAYRVEANTVLSTVGYNLPFGPRDSLDFSWRRAQSTSVEASTVFGKSRYVTDQFSLVYLLRF